MVETNYQTEVKLEEMNVITFMGEDGKAVGRLTDGLIILFSKNNPYVN